MISRPASAAAGGTGPGADARAQLQRLKAGSRRSGEASFFWYEAQFRRVAVKVLPGEYAVHGEDLVIATVLGSCIACCLWDREARVGGMNHFMLPGGAGDGARYGAFAMELLINELLKLGARRGALEAKLFGGGRVLAGMASFDVGERNTQFAFDYLRTERVPVVSHDVLDVHPRKLVFLPLTGKALVKRLASGRLLTLAERERAAAVPASTGTEGSVELF